MLHPGVGCPNGICLRSHVFVQSVLAPNEVCCSFVGSGAAEIGDADARHQCEVDRQTRCLVALYTKQLVGCFPQQYQHPLSDCFWVWLGMSQLFPRSPLRFEDIAHVYKCTRRSERWAWSPARGQALCCSRNKPTGPSLGRRPCQGWLLICVPGTPMSIHVASFYWGMRLASSPTQPEDSLATLSAAGPGAGAAKPEPARGGMLGYTEMLQQGAKRVWLWRGAHEHWLICAPLRGCLTPALCTPSQSLTGASRPRVPQHTRAPAGSLVRRAVGRRPGRSLAPCRVGRPRRRWLRQESPGNILCAIL